METVLCYLNFMDKDKPVIYNGSEGVVQLQIAIRYLHDIPNDLYSVKIKNSGKCMHCDRLFLRVFIFIDNHKDNKDVDICHACIYHLGPSGVLSFLQEVNGHENI